LRGPLIASLSIGRLGSRDVDTDMLIGVWSVDESEDM